MCFCGVILVGAPYLPTLKPQVGYALDLANLKPGQRLIELGCGDGRVLVAAAERGIVCVGYELNPILAITAWLRTRKYGSQVKVVVGNFWRRDWPETDAVFVFLLGRYMKKLNKKCIQYRHKPFKLVSVAFKIPEKKIVREKRGIYLYLYN